MNEEENRANKEVYVLLLLTRIKISNNVKCN